MTILGFSLLTAGIALSQSPSLVLEDGGIEFPDGTVQMTAGAAGFAPVEDTGQQECRDDSGTSIPCSGTGQDGEFQAGVEWPTPRFTDNGNGTVTDNLTGSVPVSRSSGPLPEVF